METTNIHTQECCGDHIPEVIYVCAPTQLWEPHSVYSPCDDPDHVCPNAGPLSTLATSPSTLATCPPEHPEPWSPCDLQEQGHQCPYGGQVHR